MKWWLVRKLRAREEELLSYETVPPDELWDHAHMVMNRSIHKGVDMDECFLYSGLTSAQMREWFALLADGNDRYHIDHIRPKSHCGDITELEQIKRAFHYSNLQPLRPGYNGSKRGRFTDEDEAAWSARTADITACATFEDAKELVIEKGINNGDQLWSWRTEDAPRNPFTDCRKLYAKRKRS